MERKWIATHLNIFYLNQIKSSVVVIATTVAVVQTRPQSGMNTMKPLEISSATGFQKWVIKFFYQFNIIYIYIHITMISPIVIIT